MPGECADTASGGGTGEVQRSKMDNNNPWLQGEIAQWVREGLISDEQAARLRARYPIIGKAPREPLPWGKVIFSALGVGVFALGVILFFAYNWQGMHRYAKLAVIGIGLLTAHGAAGWLRRGDRHDPALAESLQLLGTLLFGAGIWLVAQIYHFEVYYPNGFLLWALAALAMAWALPSITQGLLALGLLAIWGGMESLEYGHSHHYASLLIVFTLLPLAWWQRSRTLLAGVLLGLPLAWCMSVWRLQDSWVLVGLWAMVLAYLALARVAPLRGFEGAADSLRFHAALIGLPLLYIGSFIGLPAELARWPDLSGLSQFALLLPVMSAVVLGLLVLALPSARPEGRNQWLAIAGLWLPLMLLLPLSAGIDMAVLGRTIFNLQFLGLALYFIHRGTETLSRRSLSLGCAMLTLLALARFSDLFHSLLLRSLLFLVLGAALFIAGLRYSRQSAQRKLERPHA